MHPEAGDKIGPGVDSFSVERAPGRSFGTRCFWVTRSDGTRTEFSYLTCLSGKARSPLADLMDAARAAAGVPTRSPAARRRT